MYYTVEDIARITGYTRQGIDRLVQNTRELTYTRPDKWRSKRILLTPRQKDKILRHLAQKEKK